MRFFLVVLAFAGAAGIAALSAQHLLSPLWIPAAMVLFLIGFPLAAVPGKSALFYGLFDLPLSPKKVPIRHFLVTLAAFAVSASAWCLFRLMLVAGPDRMGTRIQYWAWVNWLIELRGPLSAGRLLAAIGPPLVLAAYFVFFALIVSCREGNSLLRVSLGIATGLVVDAFAGFLVLYLAKHWLIRSTALSQLPDWVATPIRFLRSIIDGIGPGYQNHWADHIFAILAAFLVLALYAALGIYGATRLGKGHTVPALAGPLMAVVVLGWWGAAAEFYLCGWNIPLLLVVALFGLVNGMIPLSDHTYEMVGRNAVPAPSPFTILTANGRKVAIVVSAAGGGIQAAAWTAKVLEELHWKYGPKFDNALSLISSISGGSMGSACYVNWIAQGAQDPEVSPYLRTPFDAASDSSLDEVAWGLAWPDLIRLFLPIPCNVMMDRSHAMERAWCGNVPNQAPPAGAKLSPQLTGALSDWNASTARGTLPSVLMNSTIVETGGPLLLGTADVITHSGRKRASSAWMDGDALHVEGKDGHIMRDVPVVRAARLSATFPYVTPTARPAKAYRQPHMMDGGFYDNYGMASLTEWVDQALEQQSKREGPAQVEKILVLQINGFPPSSYKIQPPAQTRGGWVLQLIAPILALVSVRTAGQASHRDIELELLQDKWKARGIEISSACFELNREDAPLSWHLTPSDIAAIKQGWREPDHAVKHAQEKVEAFLASV